MSIIATYKKSSAAVLDYAINWSDFLAGDSIATSTWAVSPSGLTIDSETETTTVTTVWVSGGTVGVEYLLTNTITTAGGRTSDRTLQISIGSAYDPMIYATTGDVQARLGGLYTLTSSSKPSLSQVGAWLAETSAKVDIYLRRAGYATVPVTGPNDLQALKGVVADKVALQVLYVALGARNVPDSSRDILSGFLDFLAMLAAGEAVLIDQSPTRNTFKVVFSQVHGAAWTPTSEDD